MRAVSPALFNAIVSRVVARLMLRRSPVYGSCTGLSAFDRPPGGGEKAGQPIETRRVPPAAEGRATAPPPVPARPSTPHAGSC